MEYYLTGKQQSLFRNELFRNNFFLLTVKHYYIHFKIELFKAIQISIAIRLLPDQK